MAVSTLTASLGASETLSSLLSATGLGSLVTSGGGGGGAGGGGSPRSSSAAALHNEIVPGGAASDAPPSGWASREIIVVPLTYRGCEALRHDAWLETRRVRVERAGGGQIGYVSLRSMAPEAYGSFASAPETRTHGEARLPRPSCLPASPEMPALAQRAFARMSSDDVPTRGDVRWTGPSR